MLEHHPQKFPRHLFDRTIIGRPSENRVGKLPEGATILVVLFSVSSQVHLLTGPGTSILKAIGKPRMEFHYSLSNVVLLAVIVPVVPRTVTGIAAACVAATILSAAWFIARAHAEMGVSLRRYALDVLLPGLVPYAAGMILLQLAPAATGRSSPARRWRAGRSAGRGPRG